MYIIMILIFIWLKKKFISIGVFYIKFRITTKKLILIIYTIKNTYQFCN